MCTTLESRRLVITNPSGLHARPAEMFARTAMQFEAQVELIHCGQRVDGKSILHILTLGAAQGTELLLEVRGADARQAIEALAELVERNFADNGTWSQEQAG
jgi:phosphotransferase system HPr (HPr) family protein